MVNWKPDSKAEAPGLVKQPFSPEDWSVFQSAVCAVPWGVVPCQELSLRLFQTCAVQSQAVKEHPVCGLLSPANVESKWGQGTVTLGFGRAVGMPWKWSLRFLTIVILL